MYRNPPLTMACLTTAAVECIGAAGNVQTGDDDDDGGKNAVPKPSAGICVSFGNAMSFDTAGTQAFRENDPPTLSLDMFDENTNLMPRKNGNRNRKKKEDILKNEKEC